MDTEERQETSQKAHCARCGVTCALGEPAPCIDYSLPTLNAAQTTRGMCACCAVHWWLFTVDSIRWSIRDGGKEVLALPVVQRLLSPLLAQMHPELGEVDWGRMLSQWDMAWPKDWMLPI